MLNSFNSSIHPPTHPPIHQSLYIHWIHLYNVCRRRKYFKRILLPFWDVTWQSPGPDSQDQRWARDKRIHLCVMIVVRRTNVNPIHMCRPLINRRAILGNGPFQWRRIPVFCVLFSFLLSLRYYYIYRERFDALACTTLTPNCRREGIVNTHFNIDNHHTCSFESLWQSGLWSCLVFVSFLLVL